VNAESSEGRIIDPARITQIREAAGLTRADLARECGFTLSHLCKVEKGRNRLSRQYLVILAETLERLGLVAYGAGLDAISAVDPRHATLVSIVPPDLEGALRARAVAAPDVTIEKMPPHFRRRVQVADGEHRHRRR
jgi:transcriptional regulator with XRE-family HTH domain